MNSVRTRVHTYNHSCAATLIRDNRVGVYSEVRIDKVDEIVAPDSCYTHVHMYARERV